ncbi:hypothetical protein KR222_005183 [Zaprionus bogoriensis]|nr:hypothetical protein KR222_005183 [Zaprionus bogoriensis]
MSERRAQTVERKQFFQRTPNVKNEIAWNTLNVAVDNVRCFTPTQCEFRSPNLSPIKNMQEHMSPISPMVFRQKFEKQQAQRLMSAKTKLDNLFDDSSSTETSLCVESRRRSLQATNHSYVINHASTVNEVLQLVGLERYQDKFEKYRINLVDLVSMKRSDLKKIGLRKEEDCNRILKALEGL